MSSADVNWLGRVTEPLTEDDYSALYCAYEMAIQRYRELANMGGDNAPYWEGKIAAAKTAWEKLNWKIA